MKQQDGGWNAFFGTVALVAVLLGGGLALVVGYFIGHFSNPKDKTVTVGRVAVGSGSSSGSGSSGGLLGPSGVELTAGAGVDWPAVGGDLGNRRYSSLTGISTANASKLHLVWQGSFGATITPGNFNGGAPVEAEGSPLVFKGVMYYATPQSDVVSIDAATGKLLWRWKSNVEASQNLTATTSAQRGIALGSGDVFVETAAGNLVAIDARTGQLRWQKKVALAGTHLESPAAPQYYDGVVYTGVSGQEVARGHIDAYVAMSGKRLWRTFLVCGPTGTPPASGQCPKASSAANEGGASVWTYPAVDPKYGLVYATTANPSANAGKPGDDRWATSVVAMSMKTGRIAWGFQGVHHDLWDYDCLTPPVLFSGMVDGQMHDGVEFTCKSDEHFELDRKTGKPLLAVKEVPVPTSAQGKTPDVAAQKTLAASPTQPIPAGDSDVVPHCATPALLPDPAPDGSKYVYSCTYATPGSKAFIAHGINALGGQDDDPLAYNPKLGYMYFCEKVSVAAAKLGSSKQGGAFTGVTTGWGGSVAAVSVKDNNMAWLNKLDAKTDGSCFGGSATTASNVLFTSSNKGMIYAYDAQSGKKLWSYKAPDFIASPPVVYEAGGKEYVAYEVGGQVALLGGETSPHLARLMVFSIDAPALASAKKLTSATAPSTTTAATPATAPSADKGAVSIFTQNCGSCHTLAAAGTTGSTGPNLDQLKPDLKTIVNQVINGGGAMPAFGKTHVLTDPQIQAVSKYVAQVAGQKP